MDLGKINILIQESKKGDEKAFFSLYNLFFKSMYNSALRILNNPLEAEDATQEGFIKAFIKLNTYKNDAPFDAWLRRIVINSALQLIRKNKGINWISFENDLAEPEPPIFFINEDACESDKQVLNAMQKLKINYRTILQLHYIEGFDYEEICQILNISYANCKTLMSRAKEKLSEILNN
jgi:RNA polymerase sigma factor (sigma-70 family)